MITTELVLLQTIIELIVNYGIEGFLEIIKTWSVTSPSIEDIEALRTAIKPPEEYFKEG